MNKKSSIAGTGRKKIFHNISPTRTFHFSQGSFCKRRRRVRRKRLVVVVVDSVNKILRES